MFTKPLVDSVQFPSNIVSEFKDKQNNNNNNINKLYTYHSNPSKTRKKINIKNIINDHIFIKYILYNMIVFFF